VDILLKAGVDVNGMNCDGWTPLHFAAENNDEIIVGLLLEYKADPTARTKDGKTPSDLLAASASPALKKCLGDAVYKQSPNKQNIPVSNKGKSVVESALTNNSSPIVEQTPQSTGIRRALFTEDIYRRDYVPYTEPPVNHGVSGIRNSVVEKLIELVEQQSHQIEDLKQQVNELQQQVKNLSNTGFPYTLELKLDGRNAVYSLKQTETGAT